MNDRIYGDWPIVNPKENPLKMECQLAYERENNKWTELPQRHIDLGCEGISDVHSGRGIMPFLIPFELGLSCFSQKNFCF